MTHDWLLYIAAFATSFGVSLVLTPTAKKISYRVGAVDKPKKRGMHDKPMPRLGGIAIVSGFLVSLLLMYPFIKEFQDFPTKQMIGFLMGMAIIVTVGIIDDLKNLKAKLKFTMQLVAAIIVVYSGTQINVVMWPFTTYLQAFSKPITLIWIIGVTNAVNLIDGLDGLAAGVSSIAALTIMILCAITGSELAVVLTAALAGSCLGFLPRNFNPAEIFMGDTGATFLGFVLAVTSILGVFKGYAVLALLVSCLSLGLPIFDTLFAMFRRLIHHKPVMQADRGHLHHRLIDRGFSHKQAVMILYGISIFFGLGAILISIQDIRAIIITVLAFLVISTMLYVYSIRSHKE